MKRRALFLLLILFALPAPPAASQIGGAGDGSSDGPAPVARPASGQVAKEPDAGAVVRGIIERTNAFRKEHKRPPVEADAQLTKAARYFADYMAKTRKYGHTADGKKPAQRAAAHGYAFCVVLENIAYQYNSAGFETKELAGAFFTGWRESPGHRKNMLDADVQHTGVAVARAADGTWYAVQMFGRPESARIEFKLTNTGERAVRYAVGGERFTLEPRWTRTHTLCRPATVAFTASAGGRGKGKPRDAKHESVRPAHGSAYEVTADAAGNVEVRPAEARRGK